MAFPPDDDRIISGISTLEVRWIRPGQLEAATVDWFERFAGTTESREDAYLVVPQIDGLSVKIRGDRQLDVKTYRGSPGVLDIPGRARGRIDRWQRWSFPIGAASERAADSAVWRRVRKARSIGWFGGTEDDAISATGLEDEALCAVELTQITIGERPWWTLCLEATGPPGARRVALDAAASFVFDESSGFGEELHLDDSRTYSEWLLQQIDRT